MVQIFISYRSTDRKVVRQLADDLKQLGHTVWFDPNLTSTGGQDWWNNILAQIRACDIFIFALTDSSLASVPCQSEYYYAAQLRKRILPVVIRPSDLSNLPYELKAIQYVSYERRSRDQVIALAGSLANLPQAVPLPDPLPAPPPVPILPQERIVGEIEKLLLTPALTEEQQAKILFDVEQLAQYAEYKARARELVDRFLKRDDLLSGVARNAEAFAKTLPRRASRRWVLPATIIVAILVLITIGVVLPGLSPVQRAPTPSEDIGAAMAATLTKVVAGLYTNAAAEPTVTPALNEHATNVAYQTLVTTLAFRPSATASITSTPSPSVTPPNPGDSVAATKAQQDAATATALASITPTPTPPPTAKPGTNAVITPYDNKVAVWIVAGDQISEKSIDEVAQSIKNYAPAVNAVYVKVADGSDWMAKYDTKAALHIDGPAAIDRWVNTLQKYGLEFHAWAVPRGLDIEGESRILIQAAQRPGVRSLILDVEPYQGFWAGGKDTIRPLMTKIRGEIPAGFHIGISVDARSAHYSEIYPEEWFPFINSIHVQAFWPDLGTTPDEALAFAFQTWGNHGLPVFPELSAYGTDPAQMDTARSLSFTKYHAAGFSWWVWGHIDAAHFVAVNHTVDGKIVEPPPGTAGAQIRTGTPIVVDVGSSNYRDGMYDTGRPGFSSYASPNGGTGKYRAVDMGVANVWAVYDPHITNSGWYKIEAFIPNAHATTGNARYKIFGIKEHPGEWTDSVAQSSMSNDWINLGTFQIDSTQPQPGVVTLTDWTFEVGREIAWDSIRWTPISNANASTVLIDVPYHSQEGADARRYRNDPGPAVVAMLLDWQQKVKATAPLNITIDQLASETSLATSDTGLSTKQLVDLAASHGLTLTLRNGLSLDDIRAEVGAGRPVLLLIGYGALLGRENQAYAGGHYVLVVGFDNDNAYLNDPDWWNQGTYTAAQGHNWKVPLVQFKQAIVTSPVPGQGAFVVP